LRIKLVTETSLYYDARLKKHQIIFCQFYLELFSSQEGFGKILSYVYLDRLVKCQIFFPDINQSGFSQQISIDVCDIRLRENLSSGSRVSQSGQTDRRADMTKLIFAFRNSVNSPKE